VRLAEFQRACLIRLTAAVGRSCACPCGQASHQGACQTWVHPGQTYYLALVGSERRPRQLSVCSGCVAALGKAGHLHGVTNYEALNVDRTLDAGEGNGVEP
jgi:hypothetical protein